MRIAFDVTPLTVSQSGVGTYTANLLQHLEAAGQDQILPLSHRSPGSSSRSPNKTLWMQTSLPWQLSKLQPDVCHFTNNVGAWWTPCPSVLTIHDMTLWLFPQYHYRRRLLAMRPFIPLAAHQAAQIIAVSHSTKRDIVRLLNIAPDKVTVIHEAPSPIFQPISDNLDELRRTLALPDRFILYVGTIEPRKNLTRLLEAFALLRQAGLPHHLVVVGSKGWKYEGVFASVERLRLEPVVHFFGHVAIELLR